MNEEEISIKKKVSQVITTAIGWILLLIISATLYFKSIGNSGPLVAALSLVGNYAGAIATLAAAYIASLLFNDWRKMHRANYISATCERLKNSILSIDSEIYDLKIILDSTDSLKGGLSIALVKPEHLDEIRNMIPSIKSSCRKITHDIQHLESDLLSLKYISMEAFLKINPIYTELNKGVDSKYKEILVNRGTYDQFQILSRSKSFISVSHEGIRSLQDITLKEIDKLNSPN
ncbi:hypothetical protein B9T31_12035 [Acinetobacter sp. ANC 4558]|uniref:hypothetical protein n=1 Tax=Acinetobacter sp. ANC 4558 TaxID=1977876 RepID=UPI000A3308C7|nr:hypothetical protein [Acinetobacter sp. ANC 4558]OTG85514.1 hypothetical protein B9T31_12035 [Acinetobacter sp. ANC 4558]